MPLRAIKCGRVARPHVVVAAVSPVGSKELNTDPRVPTRGGRVRCPCQVLDSVPCLANTGEGQCRGAFDSARGADAVAGRQIAALCGRRRVPARLVAACAWVRNPPPRGTLTPVTD